MMGSVGTKSILSLFLLILLVIFSAGVVNANSPNITNIEISPGSGTVGIGGTPTLHFHYGCDGGCSDSQIYLYSITMNSKSLTVVSNPDGEITYRYDVVEGDTAQTNTPYYIELCDEAGHVDCTVSSGTAGFGVDATRPYMTSLSYGDNYLKNGQSTTVTVNFSEQILNISEDDFTSTYATFSGGVCSNATQCSYTMTINSAGNYTGQTVSLNGSLYTDLASNNASNQTSAQTFTIDNYAPYVTAITMGDYDLKAGESTLVYFNFSENVTGFTSGDVSYPNGSLSGWTADSGSVYHATFTANGIHDETNQISIPASGWTDYADNSPSAGLSSSNYTITPPYALSATYNANEGSKVMTITFDEVIDASSMVGSKIHVRQAGSATGGVTLSGSVVTNSDGTTIALTTSEAERIAIKNLAAAYGTTNLEVDLDAGAFQEADVGFADEADTDNDITYTTDTTKPLVSSVTADDTMLTEADVGSGQLVVTTVFNEEMDTLVYPVIEFLPDASSTLSCSGAWSNATTFAYTCDVSDMNVDEDNIHVRVTGAKDTNTDNQMLPDTEADIFSIDTLQPEVSTLTVNDTWVGEDNAGVGAFIVTVNFGETMNTVIPPGIVFLPSVSTTLSCGGVWTDSDTYTYTCDVTDVNVEQANIDIRITNAKDLVGNNMVPYTSVDKYNVDTITPTIIIDDNASTSWTNSDTISSSPSDGLGISETKWVVRTDSTCGSGQDAALNSGTSGYTLTADSEGTYYNKYICFRTKDNAGNKQYVSSAQIAKLDTSAPTTSVSGNTAGWSNANETLSFTSSALNSGLQYLRISDSNGTYISSASNFSYVVSTDGNHVITYWSIDNAGNVDSNHVVYAAVDKTNPVTSVDGNSTGWSAVDEDLTFSATDATSGVNTIYMLDSNGTYRSSASSISYKVSTDGNHVITYWSKDNATNLDTNKVVYAAVDKNAPTTIFTQVDGNGGWNTTAVDFNFRCTDADSGCHSIYYKIDAAADWATYTDGNVRIVTDGNHRIQYYSDDNVSNAEVVKTRYIAIYPTVHLYDHNIVMDLNLTDSMVCRYDSNTSKTFSEMSADTNTPSTGYSTTPTVWINSKDSNTTYTYSVVCSDASSNTLAFPITSVLTAADVTDPLITIGTLGLGHSNTTVPFTVSEPASCRHASGTDSNYAAMSSDTQVDYTWSVLSSTVNLANLTALTGYTYTFTCVDANNNDSNRSITFTTQSGGPVNDNTGGSSTGGIYIPHIGGSSSSTVVVSDTTSTFIPLASELAELKDESGNNMFTPQRISEILKESSNFSFTREVIVSEIASTYSKSYTTTLVIRVTNRTSKDQENVFVVETVPKAIAATASQIKSTYEFRVLAEDPVIQFIVPALKSGQTKDINYTIASNTFPDLNTIKFAAPAVLSSQDAVMPINTPTTPKTPSTGTSGTSQVTQPGQGNTGTGAIVQTTTPMDLKIPAVVIAIIIIIAVVVIAVKKSRKRPRNRL